MKGRLVAEGIPKQRISVIHNWADGDAISPRPSFHRSYRREWGLEDKFVVGYSGNLGRAHEFDTILDAATQLSSEKNIAFIFIGGGAQRERVEEEGLSRGLDNLVFQP